MNIPSNAQASPLRHILSSISSKASTGAISATDAAALSDAATGIGSTLSGEGASAAKSGPPRLSPDDMKSRVESLVDGEVETGTLTSDQAATLKDIFSQDAAQGGRGGPRGAGGPPHGAPPPGADSDDDGTSLSTSSASSDGSTSVSDLLKSFLEQLRSTQSSTTGYASGAQQTSNSQFSATLIDFQT